MPFTMFLGDEPLFDIGDFTPDMLGSLLAWFKADEIVGSNLDPQGTMVDASGNGWDGTADSSPRRGILHVAEKNGLNTLEIALNGFAYCWYNFGNMYNGKTAGSMYVVTKTTEVPPTSTLNANTFHRFNNIAGGASTDAWPSGSGNSVACFGSTSSHTITGLSAELASWHMVSFHSMSALWRAYLNGELIYNTATNTFGVMSNPLVGGVGASDDIRQIAEIIWTDAFESDADRQKIEGYLALKWWGSGNHNPLPSDHPYKGENPPPHDWTPIDLGVTLLAWYKTDPITGSDGDKIDPLVDYSGHARNLTNEGGTNSRAALLTGGSGLNGMSVARFKSTDSPSGYKAYAMPNMFSGKSQGCVFMVLKNDVDPAVNASGDNNCLFHIGTTTFADVYSYTDNNVYGRFGTNADKVFNPTPSLASWHIMSMHSASSDWRYYLNGVSVHSTGTNTVGFRSAPVIGATSDHSSFYGGNIAEIIFCDTVLSTGDRQKVEGYLAHKWWGAGAANTLDSGHPYKNDPPPMVT